MYEVTLILYLILLFSVIKHLFICIHSLGVYILTNIAIFKCMFQYRVSITCTGGK